jgi:hypothetical protein
MAARSHCMGKRIIIGVYLVFLISPNTFSDNSIIYRFYLPFKDKEARYFFNDAGTFYFGEQAARTLYRVTGNFTLEKIDDMGGWFIADACPYKGKIYYCSRQRLLYKENNKVKQIPLDFTTDLLSITTDGSSLYLLDQRSDGYYILGLNADFTLANSTPCPGREPSDILFFRNTLWVYDVKSRSIINYDPGKKQELFRIYTGVDNSHSKGFVFYKDRLYVHNRDTSSLNLVEYKVTDNAVLSLPLAISFLYKIENRNISSDATVMAEFRIPIPADSPEQVFSALTWISPPDRIKSDCFEQDIAYFEKKLSPGSSFLLSYKADLASWAISSRIKETPLESLDSIPQKIRENYLSNDSYFSMDSGIIKKAALKARKNRQGDEPGGVKELVENISGYIMTTLSYHQDDTWENAETVLKNKTGSCSEYSFLFSALARLNSIPTRLAGGCVILKVMILKSSSANRMAGSSCPVWEGLIIQTLVSKHMDINGIMAVNGKGSITSKP